MFETIENLTLSQALAIPGLSRAQRTTLRRVKRMVPNSELVESLETTVTLSINTGFSNEEKTDIFNVQIFVNATGTYRYAIMSVGRRGGTRINNFNSLFGDQPEIRGTAASGLRGVESVARHLGARLEKVEVAA